MKLGEWVRGLFPHEKKVRYILVAFALLLLLAFGTKCHAEEPELRFEVGSTIVRAVSPAIVVSLTQPKLVKDVDGECFALLVGGADGNKGVMGVGCSLIDGFGPVDIGIGVVYLNHTDRLNGSQLNFMPQVGWQITDRFALKYRHISNSGTTPNNTGRDMVLFTYRF